MVFHVFKRILNRIFEAFKAILVLPAILLPKKKYWLIGGALGEHYDENAQALHKYIRKHHPDIEIYYVINKNARCISEIQKVGPVLYRHTLKTNIMALRASVLICTHSISADICRYSKFFLRGLSVYLDHGIRGFKANPPSNRFDFDIIESTGDIEKGFKEKWCGTSGNNVYITGLPMQDSLLQKTLSTKQKNKKQIIYIPTWRSWLVERKKLALEGEKGFIQSEYYQRAYRFLNSNRLQQILTKNNIELHTVFHRNVHCYYNALQGIIKESTEQVFIANQGCNIQNYLASSDLMITDYSSVAFDFLLLNKPIIFYQYDQSKFKRYHKPLVNFDTHLFGPVVFDEDSLLDEIEKSIKNNFTFDSQKYQHIKDGFLKYSDGKSCERITKLILERLA